MPRRGSSAKGARRSWAGAPRPAATTTAAFQIQTEALEPSEQTQLTRALNQAFEAESSVQTVSASFGRKIAKDAILAILVSLLLVAIYISFRFQPKFAGPVMVALVHDVLITVGIYALLGREVTTATVAAVLTVLGYSIYDTIIILDRVRENIPLMKRASFRTLANVSLWETIPRSLATTFITLLPITALYFFGGDTLKDFGFALLVGIGAGAYSSIFIAAPLVAVLKEREPEYMRRRDDSSLGDAGSVGGLLKEAEALAAGRPTPDLIPDALQGEPDGGGVVPTPAPAAAGEAQADGRRREAGAAPSAPKHPPPWPRQITAPSRCASCSRSWARSCAPASRSSGSCRTRPATSSPASSGSRRVRSSTRSSSGWPSSSTGSSCSKTR